MEGHTEMQMPPWEQHAAVINMPRFLYTAASSLHQNPHAGFLITCPFRREKSATKEAMQILQKLCNQVLSSVPLSKLEEKEARMAAGKDVSQANPSVEIGTFTETGGQNAAVDCNKTLEEGAPDSKRLKATPLDEAELGEFDGRQFDEVAGGGKEQKTVDGRGQLDKPVKEVDQCSHEDAGPDVQVVNSRSVELFLVKLAKMGILFITAPTMSPSCVVLVVSTLLDTIEAGVSAPLNWCHRVLPVQATCSLERGGLQAVITDLFKQHLADFSIHQEQPLKYAIAFNRRGVDEQSGEPEGFDKKECITAVAEAVQKVHSNTSVDLTSPEVVIFVEALPLSGSRPRPVCAVSVVPGTLVDCKPRLCIKPLIIPKKKKPA